MRLLSTFLTFLLIPTLAVLPVSAEVADSLQIKPLDSGAVAVAANSTSTDWFKVQVTDSTGAPVADAAVALRLPEDGPSGTFGDGSRAVVAYTDASGYAKFPPVRWGGLNGAVIVSVTAVKGEARAGLLVRQMINPAVAVQAAAKPVVAPAVAQPVTQPVTQATVATPQAAAPVVVAPPVVVAQPAPVAAQSVPISQSVPGTPAPVSAKAVAQTTTPKSTGPSSTPVVSITNTSASGGSTHTGGSSNTKKWVLLAIVAAGAGLGAALAMSSHGGAAAATTPGLSIGTPTFSLGH